MATASSAQREPSMEEILASIRRIIEDSDGGRRPVGDISEQIAEEDAAEAEPQAAGTDTGEVEVFRSELRSGATDPDAREPAFTAPAQEEADSEGAEVATFEPAGTVAARPTSLAEVGARVTAGEDFSAAAAIPDVAPDITAKVEPWRANRPTGRAEPLEAAHDAGTPSHEPQLSGEPQVEIDDSDLILDEEEDEASAGISAARPSLVSEQTSRQVAAAFGELSEAFASRGKKSFDEMAEEMLRPMLQDWLDNNLPTLVERLVREEIERVARGAN